MLRPDAPVLVLDTNVCLDLFVFRDPRWSHLLAAMRLGHVQAVTRNDCRNEWHVVLGYRQLPLDEQSRANSRAEFDGLIRCGEFPAMPGIVLPRCSDGDDQKFLELARDAKAAWLITKDKALLKLARKTAQAGLFRIGLPQTWLAAQMPVELPLSAASGTTAGLAFSAASGVRTEWALPAAPGATAEMAATTLSAAPTVSSLANLQADHTPACATTLQPPGRTGSGDAI